MESSTGVTAPAANSPAMTYGHRNYMHEPAHLALVSPVFLLEQGKGLICPYQPYKLVKVGHGISD